MWFIVRRMRRKASLCSSCVKAAVQPIANIADEGRYTIYMPM